MLKLPPLHADIPQSPLCAAAVSPDSANADSLDDAAHSTALPHHDQLLTSLEKQLSIETKVKNGAENMIQSITSGRHGRDKKQLLAEAQQMLADAKAKIEFLKLRILKVRQNRQLNKAAQAAQAQSSVSRPESAFVPRNPVLIVQSFRSHSWPATRTARQSDAASWKRRWRSASRSCCIGCASRPPWWRVRKM